MFKTPFRVSNLARYLGQTVYWRGPWSIFCSHRHVIKGNFFNTVHPGGLETCRCFRFWNLGRIWRCPCFIDPLSQLDSICKLFEKILLSRNLYKVNGRGLLRDEQFRLRHKHGTALQLTHLVERAYIDCDSTTSDRMNISKEMTKKQKIIPILISSAFSSFPPHPYQCLTSLTSQHCTSVHTQCTCMHHTNTYTHTPLKKEPKVTQTMHPWIHRQKS